MNMFGSQCIYSFLVKMLNFFSNFLFFLCNFENHTGYVKSQKVNVSY